MKHLIAVALFCMVGSAGLAQSALFFGKWIVQNPPDSISGDLEAPGKPFWGERFVLKPRRLQSFYRRTGLPPFQQKKYTCRHPAYSVRTEDAERFYQTNDFPLDPAWINASGDLQVLSVECPAWRGQFYYLNENWLLHTHQGLVCFLKRKGH